MKTIPPLSREAQLLELRRHQHDGQEFQVYGVANHSENLEEFVLYELLGEDNRIFARPLKIFLEKDILDTSKVPLSRQGHHLKLGRYRHFKGGEYQAYGIANHTETLEELVVYEPLNGYNRTFLRPIEMFLEEVEFEGKKIPRFAYVDSTIV